jgi:hypothetical protein
LPGPAAALDLETVEEIRINMAEHGQLVEIIVFPHPTLVGHYLCADGNHRLAAKRLPGETIRCRVLDKAPDEAELITIRVTTATIRKPVDKAAVGADVFRWMQITGTDQVQATANFGYASQSTASKLLRPYTSGSSSQQPDAMVWDLMHGNTNSTSSFSEHYEQVLQDHEFMVGRTGGPDNGFLADAVVLKSGEPFRDG